MNDNIRKTFEELRIAIDNEIAYKLAVEELGEDKVVKYDESKITEDTICFIGVLHITDPIPSYNLKYVFGDLVYQFEKVINLENLEYVKGSIQFFYPTISIKNMDNLNMDTVYYYFNEVGKILECELPDCKSIIHLEDCIPEGLVIPKNTNFLSISLDHDFDASCLNIPDKFHEIRFYHKIPKNIKLPNNLEKLRTDFLCDKDAKGLIIPQNLKVLKLERYFDNIVLPDYFPNLTECVGLQEQIEYNNSKNKDKGVKI